MLPFACGLCTQAPVASKRKRDVLDGSKRDDADVSGTGDAGERDREGDDESQGEPHAPTVAMKVSRVGNGFVPNVELSSPV